MDSAYEDGLPTPYANARSSSKRADVVDVALMVVGMLLPLLTQIGHAHVHGD
jgi:zinc transporter 9